MQDKEAPPRHPGRYAVSSWCWHAPYYAGRFSLWDMPAAASQLGFAAVELNDFMLPPPRGSRLIRPLLAALPAAPPHLWRYRTSSIARLAMLLARQHVACLSWTLDTDFTAGGRGWAGQAHYWRLGLQAAARLGASRVRVTLGGRPDLDTRLDDWVAARLAHCVMLAGRLAPALLVVVENHGDLSLDGARLLAILAAARVRLPAARQAALGLCFDPSHVPQTEQAQWWPRLAAEASHVHFKTGIDLDYQTVLTLLAAAGYRGPLVIEYAGTDTPEAGVRNSLALLARWSG